MANNNQPLLMTYQELRKTLIPYCKGKRPLLDMIRDIWNSSTPQPQRVNNQVVKMILPTHFKQFTELCIKENG